MGGSFGRAQTSLQWGKPVGPWAAYIGIEGVQDGGYRSSVRPPRSAASTATSATRATAPSSISTSARPITCSARPPPRRSNCCNRTGARLYDAAELEQSGRLRQRHRQCRRFADLEPARLRACPLVLPDDVRTATRPMRNPALDPAFLCFNDPVRPPTGSTASTRQSVPRQRDARRNRPHLDADHQLSARPCRRPTPTSCSATPIISSIGGSFDYGVTNFGASAELGVIQPNFYIAGSGIFLGPSGNPVSDGPVSLRTTNAYSGLYALDAFDVTDRFIGFRRRPLQRRQHQPAGSARLVAQRRRTTTGGFNPMVGATYKITSEVTAYGGYSEANRAPTPLELGCADPAQPCILASFLVSDPPLQAGRRARPSRRACAAPHDYGEDVGIAQLEARASSAPTAVTTFSMCPIRSNRASAISRTSARRGARASRRRSTSRPTMLHFRRATPISTRRSSTRFTLGSNSPFADANGNIYVQAGRPDSDDPASSLQARRRLRR